MMRGHMVDFLNWLFDINGVSTLYLLERNRVGEGIASYGEATRETRLWIERQNARKDNGNIPIGDQFGIMRLEVSFWAHACLSFNNSL